ncbi:MAG: hypothetical protein KDB56_08780 [Mycobacterium sp.]|nr:hypothetical protein [Mycobacterium sp.]
MHVGERLPARALCAAATVVAFGVVGPSPFHEVIPSGHTELRPVHLEVALTAANPANPANTWYGFLADVAETIGPGYDLLTGAATLAGIVLTPLSWIALPITIPAGLLIASATLSGNPLTDGILAAGGGFGAIAASLFVFSGVAFFGPVLVSNALLPPRDFLRNFRDGPPQADGTIDGPATAAVEPVSARADVSEVSLGVEALPAGPAVARAPGGSASVEPAAVESATTERETVESATSEPEAVEPVKDSSWSGRRPVLQPKPVSAASADAKSPAAKADSARRASRNAIRPSS